MKEKQAQRVTQDDEINKCFIEMQRDRSKNEFNFKPWKIVWN